MKSSRVMSLLVALLVSTSAMADSVTSASSAYVIVQGTIGTTPATILLNPSTGKTWFLGQVDANGHVWISLPVGQAGGATWIPIPFAPQPAPTPPH